MFLSQIRFWTPSLPPECIYDARCRSKQILGVKCISDFRIFTFYWWLWRLQGLFQKVESSSPGTHLVCPHYQTLCFAQKISFSFLWSHVLSMSLCLETTVAARTLHVSPAILLPVRSQISRFSPIAFLFHLLLHHLLYHSRADGRWCFNKVQ